MQMANQIAANVPDQQRAAEQTATHLRSFWAPVMIDDLRAEAGQEPEQVSPAVHAALATLARLPSLWLPGGDSRLSGPA